MTYSKIILLAAKKAGVSGALLLAVCTHESNLKNVMRPRDGNGPSYGICQIKYETAKQMGFKGQAKDLMVPRINAKYAAIYLRYQYIRYHGNACKAVAAYNSGSFLESEYHPGQPKNLKYLNCVMAKLPKELSDNLTCLEVKYAEGL